MENEYQEIMKKWRDAIQINCKAISDTFPDSAIPIQVEIKEGEVELEIPDFDYLVRPLLALLTSSIMCGMKHTCKFGGRANAKDFLDDMKTLVNEALDLPEVTSILDDVKQYTGEEIFERAHNLFTKELTKDSTVH